MDWYSRLVDHLKTRSDPETIHNFLQNIVMKNREDYVIDTMIDGGYDEISVRRLCDSLYHNYGEFLRRLDLFYMINKMDSRSIDLINILDENNVINVNLAHWELFESKNNSPIDQLEMRRDIYAILEREYQGSLRLSRVVRLLGSWLEQRIDFSSGLAVILSIIDLNQGQADSNIERIRRL